METNYYTMKSRITSMAMEKYNLSYDDGVRLFELVCDGVKEEEALKILGKAGGFRPAEDKED
jgi:hypothetical protein